MRNWRNKMAIEILTLDEAMENDGIKILVHGMAGSGKTVMAATAGMPTIMLSAEAGLLSLKKFMRENKSLSKNIKVIKIESFNDLQETRQWLQEENQLADWLCLDSISEIAEQILAHEKTLSPDPRKAYGNLTDQMLSELRAFRDLAGYNVLMTCKQVREVDGDSDRTRYIPSFPGRQVGPAVPYMFDEVFALRVEEDDEGNIYRTLQTSKDVHYEAKDRSGELEMFEEANLKNILNKINPDYVLLKNRENKIDEIVEEETVEEDVSEEPTFTIASKTIYLKHLETETFIVYEKGTEVPNKALEQCESITKKQYVEGLDQQQDSLDEEEPKDDENTADKGSKDSSVGHWKCCECDASAGKSEPEEGTECDQCGGTEFYDDIPF